MGVRGPSTSLLHMHQAINPMVGCFILPYPMHAFSPVFNSINGSEITVKELVSNLLFNYAKEMLNAFGPGFSQHLTINSGEL